MRSDVWHRACTCNSALELVVWGSGERSVRFSLDMAAKRKVAADERDL